MTFTYKDYAHGNVQKIMSLDAEEFLRRFCMHILPPQFTKIRHYGILASRNKSKLRFIQFSLGFDTKTIIKIDWKIIFKNKFNYDPDQCPCCKTGKMIRILSFQANAPPIHMFTVINNSTIKV